MSYLSYGFVFRIFKRICFSVDYIRMKFTPVLIKILLLFWIISFKSNAYCLNHFLNFDLKFKNSSNPTKFVMISCQQFPLQ